MKTEWPAGPVVVVGGGRLGLALALALVSLHHDVQLVVRSSERRAAIAAVWPQLALHHSLAAAAPADVMWLLVPDQALAGAAADLAGLVAAGQPAPRLVLHSAGALPAAAVAAPGQPDLWTCASLHPMCAVPDPLQHAHDGHRLTSPLPGALFAVDGPEDLQAALFALAASLGGLPVVVAPADRAVYHAAAAVVANDLVALLLAGETLLAGIGMPQAQLRAGLLHLARSSLQAVAAVPAGSPWVGGLTGAVARGDAPTLHRHLAVLAQQPADSGHHTAAELHRALSQVLVAALAQAGAHTDQQTHALGQVLDAHLALNKQV